MATGGEDKKNVTDVVEEDGKGEGEKIAEYGISLLESSIDTAFDQIIVCRKEGVGEPGEQANLNKGRDQPKRGIFDELKGYRHLT